MQRGDDRHPQVAQQAEDVAAGRAAEDAVLVLEADDVGVGEVQEVGRAEVAVELLLLDLEPDFRRVVVPLGEIVDRHHEAVRTRKLGGHRRAHVVRERGDPALPRQVVADEGDFANFSSPRHGCHKTLILTTGRFTSGSDFSLKSSPSCPHPGSSCLEHRKAGATVGAPRRDITVRPLRSAHAGIKRVRCRPRLDGHRLGRATGLRARARSRAAGRGHSSPGVRTKWVGAQFPGHRCFGRCAAPLARSGSRRAHRHFPPHRVQSIEVRPLLSQGRRRDCQQHESNWHCRSPSTSHGWKTLLHS